MRQVFSSPRIENVDRVEAMLHENGIETYATNRDKLRRDRLRRFSYSRGADETAWPAIWIKHAEDLPQARQLLRDAGLMGSTRPDIATQYMLRAPVQERTQPASTRLRRALLILVLISAIYMFWNLSIQNQPQDRPPLENSTAVSPATNLSLPYDETGQSNTVIIIDKDSEPVE